MEQLLEWAISHGASFEAVPHPDKPRKLFAAKDLVPGDIVFNIPAHLLLYGARAFDDSEYGPAFRQLQEEVCAEGVLLDQRSLLVLLLVLEKCRGPASFYAPYCDILPLQYDDPFWWSQPELQLLQGTRLYKAVQHYTTGLQQLHSWLLRLEQIHQQQMQAQQQQHLIQLPQQQQQQQQGRSGSSTLSSALNGWGLSLAAIKWARSAVWSRAFTIRGLLHTRNTHNTHSSSGGINNSSSSNITYSGHIQLGGGGCRAGRDDSAEAAEAVVVTDDGGVKGNNLTQCESGAANAADAATSAAAAAVVALVPVLDMCDHHEDQRVTWRVITQQQQQQQQQQQAELVQARKQQQVQQETTHQETPAGNCLEASVQQQQEQEPQQQVFQFTTLKPVSKGSELFNNYGTTKPNEELLLGYGFVLEGNSHDSFLVSISYPVHQVSQHPASQHTESEPEAGCIAGPELQSSSHLVPADTVAGADAAVTDGAADIPVDIGQGTDTTECGYSSDSDSNEEARCEDAAVWQQRLAAVAAAGLHLEVPISQQDPLPGKLLDVLLLTAALPAWQASTAVMQLQQQQHQEQKQQNQEQQNQQQHHACVQDGPLYDAAALSVQLKVLLQLQQQLEAKLRGMKPQHELQQLLQEQQPQSAPDLQQQQQQLQDCADQQQDQQAVNSLNPAHARLAAVYVLSQQALLESALQAVSAATSKCLEAHAVPTNKSDAATPTAQGPSSVSTAVPDAADAAERDSRQPSAAAGQGGMFGWLHPGLSWCPCCHVLSVGNDQELEAGVAADSLLLCLPLQSCLAADSERELVLMLMLEAAAAAGLLLAQQEEDQQESQHQQQEEQDRNSNQQRQSARLSYFGQYWLQQCQEGSCSPSEQVLPWWLVDSNREIVGLMQDTQAGQQLLDVSQELQSHFQEFISHTMAAAASPDAGAGNTRSMDQQLSLPNSQQLLRLLLQEHPATAFSMFCWAHRLVLRAAVSLDIPVCPCEGPAAAVGVAGACGSKELQQRQQQNMREQLVLIPGLQHMPEVLRALTLNIAVDVGSPDCQSKQQTQQHQQHQPDQTRLPGAHVHVSSRCYLPKACHFGTYALLAGSSAQQLLIDHGPQCLAAPAAATAAGSSADEAGSGNCNSLCQHSPQLPPLRHVYELVMAPLEEDPFKAQKLQLLAATGLGLSHFLSVGPDYQHKHQQQQHQQPPWHLHGQQDNQQQEHRQQQQQQHPAASSTAVLASAAPTASSPTAEQVAAVLTSMAFCLAEDDTLQPSWLTPNVVQAVQEEQQQVLQRAGLLAQGAVGGLLSSSDVLAAGPFGAGVSGTAAILPLNAAASAKTLAAHFPCNTSRTPEGGPTAAAVAAARAISVSSGPAAASSAWSSLQEQMMQRCGKAACKQLLQVLKEDARAIKAALKQLKQQQKAQQAQQGRLNQQQHYHHQQQQQQVEGGRCCYDRLLGCGIPAVDAAWDGAAVYLKGQLDVLDSWLQALQAHPSKSSDNVNKKGKGKGRDSGGSSKQPKKKAKHK